MKLKGGKNVLVTGEFWLEPWLESRVCRRTLNTIPFLELCAWRAVMEDTPTYLYVI